MRSRRTFFCTALLLLFGALLAAQQVDPKLYSEMRWRMIGPFRGGRTVAMVGIPSQPNTFFIGVNNGGVWKTTDAGRTWQSLFDDQPTQSVGAVAVAPSNPDIIYVGSGEGLQRPDLSVGDGIYKSADGGKTWQHLGLRDGLQIPMILVDPGDPNRVYVAVLGHPYGPNAERGVYRSTDGGRNWQKILYQDEDTGAVDLAFDPANPRTLYAVLWAARQGPWENGQWQGKQSGLFKSTDGGDTWRPLTQGLPGPADNLGRIGISVAASNPRILYANVEASLRTSGVYRSDDAGESWRRVNDEARVYSRGSDFAEVRPDPKDPEIVYAANTQTYKSIDGGKTFVGWKGAPGGDDYHRIWINPGNPEIIAMASDQGATITVNGGQTWSSWYNQPTAQFYHVITDNRVPYWVCGGQQESGSACVISRSDYGAITVRDWEIVGIEEYGYAAPDPLNPGIIYGGKASRYDERTHQTQDISPGGTRRGRGGNYRFLRTAPIIFSTVDPHVLYLAGNVLFKTTNGGHAWEVISPDLSRTTPEIPASFKVFADGGGKLERRGVIYAVGPSFQDLNTIWVGTDDGLIHVTRDGGKNWQNITPPELTSWSKVSQIEASHFDNDSCYAAINRIRVDDLRPYVYRTHDGGKTWQKITAGLPENEPVNAVREDSERKGMLYAGTERSVYVSFDDGGHWQALRLNLPASSVRDLVVHNDDLVVGTHGRGFWILDDVTPLRQLTAETSRAPAFLFKPQAAIRFRRSTNTDTPLPPEEPMGQNPPDGAIVDYWLAAAAAAPVTLEVLDASGKVVRRYSSADQPAPVNEKELRAPLYWVRPAQRLSAAAGMHRFVWDLHHEPLAATQRDYPIAAVPHDTPAEPLGPRALPGQYSVRLTANGQTLTQALTVKMDPRVTTSAEGLRRQFEVEVGIADTLQRVSDALRQVRALRAQAVQLHEHAGAAAEPLSAFEAKLRQLEGGGGRGFGPPAAAAAGEGPSLSSLSGSLGGVYGAVDTSDVEPTEQALAAFRDLGQEVDAALRRWHQICTADLPALNEQLRKAGLRELAVP